MGNIKIEKMVLGMVQTNTWFVINEKTKELILIDPADDAGRIIRKIEADGLKLQGILLTHGHFDHIGAVDDLRAYFKGVQCYAGEKEEEVLENGSYNLSASWAAALSIRSRISSEAISRRSPSAVRVTPLLCRISRTAFNSSSSFLILAVTFDCTYPS